jgi:hypothetical protein
VFTRQGFSLLRLGLIVGAIGIIAVAAGGVSFYMDQASRQVPLEIDVYPGSLPAGQEQVHSTLRRQYFRVVGVSPDEVAGYYQQKLDEFTEPNETCVREPRVGEYPSNQPNTVPFQFICHFDNSGFRSTQYTTVTIQPGVFNRDPARNTEGMTVIEYEQYWQPR